MHSLLLLNFAKHIQLSEEEELHIIEHFDIVDLKKKEYFSKPNTVVESIAFVNSGCLRSYTLDKSGVEHILQFAPTEWWISDIKSMIYSTKSELYIDTIEVSQLLVISRKNQLMLLEKYPQLNNYFRIVTERALSAYQQRILENMSMTAAVRYINFCIRYPQLMNNLPQKQIASYLGVTPEFLSTMRSNLIRNNKI